MTFVFGLVIGVSLGAVLVGALPELGRYLRSLFPARTPILISSRELSVVPGRKPIAQTVRRLESA